MRDDERELAVADLEAYLTWLKEFRAEITERIKSRVTMTEHAFIEQAIMCTNIDFDICNSMKEAQRELDRLKGEDE